MPRKSRMTEGRLEIVDWGGGLNTSVDEGLLPPNMTPEMYNFDILDSKTLKTRNGYESITGATPLDPEPIEHLYRFYASSGDEYWAVIAGTHFVTGESNVNYVPRTRKELSTSNVTGTCNSVSGPSYSQGRAISITAGNDVAATMPYSSSARIAVWGLAGSLQIDGGAWTSFSHSNGNEHPYYWYPNISATHHEFGFKASSVNNKSCQITATYQTPPPDETARGIYKNFTVEEFTDNYWRLYFYDDDTTHNAFRVYAKFSNAPSPSAGIYWSYGAANYHAMSPVLTLGSRTVGWHCVEFKYRPSTSKVGYLGWRLDSGTWREVEIENPGSYQQYIRIYAYGGTPNTSGHVHYYVDALGCYPTGPKSSTFFTVDDFDDITGWDWSLGATTSTAQSYGTVQHLVVDYIDYWTNASWTSGTVVSGTAEAHAMCTYNDYVYFSNKYDDIRKWNGTSVATLSATTTKAEFLVTHKERVFAAGYDTDLLEYTAAGDAEDWTGVGSGSLRVTAAKSGVECTGLTVFDDKLFFFSHSRTHAIDTNASTDSEWVNKTISPTHGCVAPKSIAESDAALIFLAADGVRSYGVLPGIFSEDGSGFQMLSEAINNDLDTINDECLYKACGAVYKNRYWLAVPLAGATENNTIFVYKFPEQQKGLPGSWVKYTGINISTLCVTRGDEYQLYGGSNESGTIYQLDTGDTDNGAVIDCYYRTPPLDPGGRGSMKHFYTLYLSANVDVGASNLDLIVHTHTGFVDGIERTLTLTGSTDVQPIRKPISAEGRSIQLEFEGSSNEQPFSINSALVTYSTPRLR